MVEIKDNEDVACEPSQPTSQRNQTTMELLSRLNLEERVEVDTREFFPLGKQWKKRKEMIDWAMEQARKAGFTMVIGRSNSKIRKPYVQMDCERGGSYDKRSEKKLKREGTGSRKCHCPFRFKGYVFLPGNHWYIVITNGFNNHKMEPKLEGHLNAGRLTGSTKNIVADLSKSLVAPKNILSHLKYKIEDNDTTIKQVYNCRQRLRASARGDKTELQHLMAKLEEHHYVHFSRTKDETSTLQDIFFAHPESIKLLNNFLLVLVNDSTYKTNMYMMPLFEIVVSTSTEKTYSVGFAFLANKKKDNFTWVLQMACGLLLSKANEPKVILTDRCTTLMNVVAIVFPDTKALLCYFRIAKNVRQHCISDCNAKPREGEDVKRKDVIDNISCVLWIMWLSLLRFNPMVTRYCILEKFVKASQNS